MQLSAGGARQVIVLGYRGEPFIRIGSTGTTVQRGSLTAAGTRITVHGRSAIWHDARVRALAPDVARRRWTIPLIVDGQRTRLEGDVWRVDAPPAWPWVALSIPFLLVPALLLVSRPTRWVRAAAIAFELVSAVALVVTGAGFALDAAASEGKWLERPTNSFLLSPASFSCYVGSRTRARSRAVPWAWAS